MLPLIAASHPPITSELQKLSPDNMVILYELDTTPIGGTEVYRFHPGVNALGNDVVWGGQTYTRFPIEAEGFERTGSGQMPRPKISVANIDGLIGAAARELGGLEGSKLIRTRTFLKYLDGVNFEGGYNPTADSSQYIEREVWVVARKVAENRIFVEFELAASFDLNGVMLPKRQYIQNVCTWRYRGAECGYTGGPVADAQDMPTNDPAKDKCGKRLSSCILRFGRKAALPYGGFPGVGLTR